MSNKYNSIKDMLDAIRDPKHCCVGAYIPVPIQYATPPVPSGSQAPLQTLPKPPNVVTSIKVSKFNIGDVVKNIISRTSYKIIGFDTSTIPYKLKIEDMYGGAYASSFEEDIFTLVTTGTISQMQQSSTQASLQKLPAPYDIFSIGETVFDDLNKIHMSITAAKINSAGILVVEGISEYAGIYHIVDARHLKKDTRATQQGAAPPNQSAAIPSYRNSLPAPTGALVPKFKVGDRIKDYDGDVYTVVEILLYATPIPSVKLKLKDDREFYYSGEYDQSDFCLLITDYLNNAVVKLIEPCEVVSNQVLGKEFFYCRKHKIECECGGCKQ